MTVHFLMPLAILLQTPDDVIRDEIGRLQRNFQGLIWGFVAAWVILMAYTLMIVLRERKIRREMERLKNMVEDTGKKS
jgi:Na+-driven multidrug efflux pump